MSRTRLIVTTIFVVILGLIAAPAVWAGSLVPGSPATVTGLTATANAVLLVDVDGDGIPDLVVVEGNPTNLVEVFLGNGTGGFSNAPDASVAVGNNPVAVAAGKLTSGVHPFDLVVSNANDRTLTVLANTSTVGTVNLAATTNSPYALPTPATATPQGLAVADINNDTNQDVIVADSGNKAVSILLGNNGTPATLTLTGSTSSPYALGNVADTLPFALVVDDFAGTGQLGIAVTNRGSGNITVYTNTAVSATDVTLTSADTSVGTTPFAIASGKILSGTLHDLVVANSGSSDISVLINDGSGNFPTATSYPTSATPEGVVLADFNNDGKNDVVVADSAGADLLINTGNPSPSTFGAFTNFPLTGTPIAISSGDFGRPGGGPDGRADVALVDGAAAQVFVELSSPYFNIQTVAASIEEGVAFPGTTALLTFQYDGSPAASQFSTTSVTDFGDGNAGAATVTLAAGTYTVAAGHTYNEPCPACPNSPGVEGAMTIDISLINATDSQHYGTHSDQFVNDAPLSPGAAIVISDIAPGATYSGPTANFIDANTTAHLTDFTGGYNIDWGDSSPNSPGDGNPVTGSQPGGIGTPFTAAGTHTYASPGTFLISTTIIDTEGGSTQQTTVTNTINVTSITPTPGAINVIEGNTLPNAYVLATFTGIAGHTFSAQMNDWGDGQGPEGLTVVPIGGPNFEVHPNNSLHFYPSPNPPFVYTPPSITVTDITDGSTSTFTDTLTVTEGVIAVTVTDISGSTTEGSPAPTAIGTFTDQDLKKGPGAYTALIDWDNCAAGAKPGACGFVAPATVGGAAGSFTVTANAATTFGDSTAYTVQIQIKDNDTGNLTSNSQVINVGDATLGGAAPVTIQKAGPAPLVVNVDLYNGSIGTFHDNAGNFADFTDYDTPGSKVTWGDGGSDACSSNAGLTPNCVISAGVGPGNMQINGKHIFTKAGSQLGPPPQVTVDIVDKGGQSLQFKDTANVTSIATIQGVIDVRDATAARPQEGILFTPDPATGAGSFTSNRGGAVSTDFTATIDWSDGNGPQPATVSGTGPFLVTGTVTYAEEGGPHAIILSVKDNVDGSTSNTVGGTNGSAIVTDAPLTIPVGQPAVPAQLEGNAFGPVAVGTFTDANPKAPLTDFPAANITINWGDGGPTSNATSVTQPGGLGTAFIINGSHTYAEPGNYQVIITVNDIGGSTVTGNGSLIQVNDAPLANGAINFPVKPVEGQAFTGQVATFTDGNPQAPLTDFPPANVQITWGDEGGTITQGTVTQPGGLNTPFLVSGTLPAPGYHEENTYNISVKVTDIDGATITINGQIKPNDAPLNAALGQPAVPAQVEGTAFGPVPVGTFNDTNPLAPLTDFPAANVVINWGDGGPTSNATSVTQPGGVGTPFLINGSHTYKEEGNFQVVFTVTDVGGATVTANGSLIAVNDAPLSIVGLTQPTVAAKLEGNAFGPLPVGTFNDTNPGAPLTDFPVGNIVIDWGDGGPTSNATSVTQPGGLGTPFLINGTHTYLEPGNYQVKFTVADIGGSTLPSTNGSLIKVNDAPLTPQGTSLAFATGTVPAGTVVGSFTDTNPLAPLSDFSGGASINWGDGNTTPGTITQPGGTGTPFQVTAGHLYVGTGTFFVTIAVADVDGATTVIASQITIGGQIASDFNTLASPPLSQRQAGQSVDVLLTLSPNPNVGGYGSTVNFTGCTVTPPTSTINCTFNPNSVPDVLQVRQVHMLVTSTANMAILNAPPRPGRNPLTQLAMLLPAVAGLAGVVLLGGSRKRKSRTMLWWGATFLLLSILLLGCGGNVSAPPGGGTPAGQYVIQPVVTDAGPNTPPACTPGQTLGCIPSVTVNIF